MISYCATFVLITHSVCERFNKRSQENGMKMILCWEDIFVERSDMSIYFVGRKGRDDTVNEERTVYISGNERYVDVDRRIP